MIILDKLTTSANPDIVIASCGDTPNIEAIACVSLLKKYLPKISLRFVNVLEVLKLETNKRNKAGLSDEDFIKYFTKDKPVIFNFHGYPSFIHGLIYDRPNKNFYVHGYEEEGSITTAFDMRLRNKIDRFSLAKEALDLLPDSKGKENLNAYITDILKRHYAYVKDVGIDLKEITNFEILEKEN